MPITSSYRKFVVGLVLLVLCSFSARAQDSSYVPSHERPDGVEVVLVYFGSHDCAPCHEPELKRAIENAKLQLDQEARKAGKSFSAVGVSLGWDVQKEFDFLKDTGRFDEVVIGKNWYNMAAAQFIWKDQAVEPGIPSILVYEQRVNSETTSISISEPEYLVAKLAPKTIIEWVETGTPLAEDMSFE